MTDAQKTLVESFLRLSLEQLANLSWHVEQGTEICCGDRCDLYIDGNGGG
jgi:hypothetical protein